MSAQGPEIYNGYGDGTIWMKPRGSEGRTPAYWALDLHADYDMPVFGKGSSKRLSIIVDAFNVFNRHQTLELDQDYAYEGMPNIDEWEDPCEPRRLRQPDVQPEPDAEPVLQDADPLPEPALGAGRRQARVLVEPYGS